MSKKDDIPVFVVKNCLGFVHKTALKLTTHNLWLGVFPLKLKFFDIKPLNTKQYDQHLKKFHPVVPLLCFSKITTTAGKVIHCIDFKNKYIL